ncbi:hypothetical protein RCG17_02155 [Neobacillus sp. PS3-12]|uniref:hypothetical protein n=1 Tax=Neobacillus sp. PS3-12 TaxID=3070677 RepID=UPI0027DF4357|nr:hypothetical protein [Neobacillus sp. PS3-12]WML53515.1 hypothetical protein RCG17_02155 [Neobacillus sp. PS3-12]
MEKRFVVIIHLIIFGFIIGGTVHFRSNDEAISLVTIFFTGILALQNIIHKMFDTHKGRTSNK